MVVDALSPAPRERQPGALVKADADILGIDLDACVTLNAGGCREHRADHGNGNGSANGNGNGRLIPAVIADVDADVLDIPVDACVRINADGCGTTGDGAGSGSNNGGNNGGEQRAAVTTAAGSFRQ